MRKFVVFGSIAVLPAIGVLGFLLAPPNQTAQCYRQIKFGMSLEASERILQEHGFKLVGGDTDGGSTTFFYHHEAEDRKIFLSIERGSKYGVHKELQRKESTIRRLLQQLGIL